jgi:uncharacterized membrane protein YraQ (UPF0718 family)
MWVKNIWTQKQIIFWIALVAIGLTVQSVSTFNLPDKLQDTITLMLGIVYEAIPFVIFGVLLSVIIGRYVGDRAIHRLLPKKSWARRPLLSLLGIFLPVCECGNIPLSRGLLQKGLKPGEVLTFLFAAPIINPITIYTTSQAFSNEPEIVVIRVLAAFIIANFVGILFAKSKQKEMLTDDFHASCELHAYSQSNRFSTAKKEIRILSKNFSDEMLKLMPALVGGSLIAGLIQTIIPRSLLLTVSSEPVLAIIAMLILAFIVSICANVDAFFALSLSGIFPTSAIVAFLVFGPMIDIKILSMLRTTFRTWVLITVSGVIFVLSLLVGLVVQYAL